jgi:hypothetical protein
VIQWRRVIHAAGSQRGADCLVGDRSRDDLAHWLYLCDDCFRNGTAAEADAREVTSCTRRARVGTLRSRLSELRSDHATRVAP